MRTNLYPVLLVLLISACSGSDNPLDLPGPGSAFEYRGLEGLNVVDLEQTDSTLIAATSNGIYKYVGGEDWTPVSPQHWEVFAITALYPSHLLASVQTATGVYRLVESLNSGDDWRIVENDFGGAPDEQTEPIFEIAFDDGTGELFATGYDVLAKSDNFGRSWSVRDGGWQRVATGMSALAYSNQYRDVWIGGQDAIENASLRRADRDTGDSTDLSDRVLEFLERPSTVEAISFYPNAESTVFVAGEGGVLRSTDYGASWLPVLTNNSSRFYFDVLIDAETGVIYTGGWDKDFDRPQPLVLEVSDDSGETWQSFDYPNTGIRGGIWSLLLAQLGTEKRLFVGLQGGGIYEVNLGRLNE